MYTQVTPCEVLTARAPHDQVLAEHSRRDWAAVRKLCGEDYGMPILYEDRVIDHRHSNRGDTLR
jgi:hypothetical protein